MINTKYIMENIADNYRTFDCDHNRVVAERSETKLLNDILQEIIKENSTLTKTEIIDLIDVFVSNKKFI